MQSQHLERAPGEFTTARIRANCRQGFESATACIVAIANGQVQEASPAVSIRAYDHLGKYGIGRQAEILLEHSEWLEVVLQVTKEHYPAEDRFEAWWNEIIRRLHDLS